MRKIALFLFAVWAGSVSSYANQFYVDADATAGGNGSSWASAFNYLQDALDQTVAGQGDEVWIAEGTYYPDDGASVTEGDRTASFTLKDGVALYGGFVGTETIRSDRDWETYTTTLSGKIYADQIYWSLHVCTAIPYASVSFDGLTVTGGNANGSGTGEDRAGAIYSPDPYWNGYKVTVDNCSIVDNSVSGRGAVAYHGTWTVSNSSFSGNSASIGGVAEYGTWTVSNSSFSGNSASGRGGVAEYGTWTVSNSSFSGNSSSYGGVASNSAWTVSNSSFSGNSAKNSGGVASNGAWTVSNSSFHENSAGEGGGSYTYGGVAYLGTWTVANCCFTKNSVKNGDAYMNTAYGGVAYGSSYSGEWTVTNSSFSGNSAGSDDGSSAYGPVAYGGTWTLTNSIIDASSSTQLSVFRGMSKFSNTYDTAPTPLSSRALNIIKGGASGISMSSSGILDLGTGYVIDADPLFVDASDPSGPDDIYGTADDGLRLQASSPAIAQGNVDFLPQDSEDLDGDGLTDELVPLDLAGFLRVQGGSIDLGAYEYGNSTEQLYTLTLQAGSGGTVNPSGSQNYSSGSNQTLTASPSAGYLFDVWTGDASGATNPLAINIYQNLSITATFAPDTADPDDDGLTNYQEIVTYGTNPELKDSSGDDLSDGDVVDAGFDPTADYSSLITLVGEQLEDARTGSTMIDVDGSNAVLQLQVQRSGDLSEWSKDPEDIIEVEIPMSPGKTFFRFAIPVE